MCRSNTVVSGDEETMVNGLMMVVATMGMVAAAPVMAQTDAQFGPLAEAAAPTARGNSTISAAVTVGTLGIGPELGFRFSDHIGIRGNATFLGGSGSTTVDANEYNASLKLRSFGAMVDVYPFGGRFRLSGGARINHNRASLSGDFTNESSVEIDDVSYTGRQVGILSGEARVKKFAPALTLGWSGSNRRGFMFGFEAGALFQGAVQIQQFTSTGTLRNDATFQARLARERQNVQDDVNDYKIYPILQTSIGWRF
jgi:hypothetical protein